MPISTQPDSATSAGKRAVPRFLLLQPEEHRAPSYCWRGNWDTGFDSAFSLFSKFALLNGLCARELARLFLSTKRGQRGKLISSLNVDLRTADIYSSERIAGLMNLSSEVVVRAFVVPVHNRQSLAESSTNLRYCRACLCSGLHMAAFQLLFVARCPLHAERLVETCESCGGLQPYKLASALFKSPFRCIHCGHDFAPRLRHPKVVCDLSLAAAECSRLAGALELVDRKSQLFGSAQLLERHFSFFGLDSVALSAPSLHRSREEYYAFIDALLNQFGSPASSDVIDDSASHIVTFTAGVGGAHATEKEKKRAGLSYAWDAKLLEVLPVYKAIRRHLWHRLLRDHRVCVRSAARHLWWDVEGDTLEAFCPFAEAFLRWRMFWESFSVPSDLYRQPRHAPFRLQAWLSEAAPICPVGWSALMERWVSHRIFAMDCWRHFHAWQAKCLSPAGRRRHRWSSSDLADGALTYWLAANARRGRGTRVYVDARPRTNQSSPQDQGRSHRQYHVAQLRRIGR